LFMWTDPRSFLTRLLVVTVAEVYALVALSAPSHAFQVSSTTGFARYVTQAAQTGYVAANRAAVLSTLAPAVNAASAGSVALRMVTGPIGWAALGISAGLLIAGMLYSDADRTQIKLNTGQALGLAPTITVNGIAAAAGSLLYDTCKPTLTV